MNAVYFRLFQIIFVMLIPLSCSKESTSNKNSIEDPFTETQAELLAVVEAIRSDIMTANIKALQSIHLDSEKFTKFGPRSFNRQDVKSTNFSEAAFFGSVSDMNYEIKDLKIDVFGDIGIVTYYPYVSFVKNGKENKIDGRQTLVFLRTNQGWKIIHEHGTIRTTGDIK